MPRSSAASHATTRRRSTWLTRTAAGAAGQSTGGRPARQDPQRGAGRPLRLRQDDAGRAAARRGRARSRARARRGRHHRLATSTRPSCASSAPWVSRSPRSSSTASRSTSSTPPGTPTSSATCAPGCAPRTRRCSSSPPSTASTARPSCCGRSAPPSACRARSWSPSSTRSAPTSTTSSRSASASSARACCRSTCRWRADDGTVGRSHRPALAAGLRLLRRARASQRDPDAEHLPLIESARGTLIEGIIAESEDETLMDRYLAGEDIDLDTLIADLETAVARGSFYPVLGRRPRPPGYGTAELLELIVRGFPSPLEHPLPAVTGARRQAARARSPATPTARCAPRSSRPRPTRTSAGSRSCGCSAARCAPTPPCTCPGHFAPRPRSRGPRRRRAGRRAVVARWARRSAPSRRRSPATSSRSPS